MTRIFDAFTYHRNAGHLYLEYILDCIHIDICLETVNTLVDSDAIQANICCSLKDTHSLSQLFDFMKSLNIWKLA